MKIQFLPVVLVLAAVLAMVLCAGCIGPSSPEPGVGNETELTSSPLPSATPPSTDFPSGTEPPLTPPPSGNGPSQSADTCSFEHLIGRTDTHLSGGDVCYFETHTPIEFLDDRRTHPDEPVMVMDVPEGWITHEDTGHLMQEIGSGEPAAPVVSPLSSYWPDNQTSTVGNEALFLLEGYRTGRYPPDLCSLYYFKADRTEMEMWWNTTGNR